LWGFPDGQIIKLKFLCSVWDCLDHVDLCFFSLWL
jgi:hypothetical protein